MYITYVYIFRPHSDQPRRHVREERIGLNTLQHTSTSCNTLLYTSTHRNINQIHTGVSARYALGATHCNTLQHKCTTERRVRKVHIGRNTLQHTATHCNTLQHTATQMHHRKACLQGTHWAQHTTTSWYILQRTAAHCGSLFEFVDLIWIKRSLKRACPQGKSSWFVEMWGVLWKCEALLEPRKQLAR